MNFNVMIARKKKGLTQEQLCDKVNICRKQLSNIENGKDSKVTKELMLKFAVTLETDVKTLFFSEEN
jgi:putative transcriptional regulator